MWKTYPELDKESPNKLTIYFIIYMACGKWRWGKKK